MSYKFRFFCIFSTRKQQAECENEDERADHGTGNQRPQHVLTWTPPGTSHRFKPLICTFPEADAKTSRQEAHRYEEAYFNRLLLTLCRCDNKQY